jgi:hypothetical protein
LIGDASNSDHRIVSPFRFAVARNSLFISFFDTSARDSVARQLLPTVLSMCEEAAADVAASTCSASLMHFLTCDLAAATVPIAEIRTSIAGGIRHFTQGNFARTLRLYAPHTFSQCIFVTSCAGMLGSTRLAIACGTTC